MLSLLILLAASQQAAPSIIPPSPPPPPEAGAMPVLGQTPFCAARPQPASDATSGGDLMWREGGQAVGHYLLLDRYVGGCPAPIIVNHRVPGSNALGREVGGRSVPRGLPPRTP